MTAREPRIADFEASSMMDPFADLTKHPDYAKVKRKLGREAAKTAQTVPPESQPPLEDEQGLAYWGEAKELIDARHAAEQAAARKPMKQAPAKQPRPDRQDKRLLTAHVEPEVYKEFKVLAAQQGMTTDLMLTKALALLFDDCGKKPPAALRRKLANHQL